MTALAPRLQRPPLDHDSVERLSRARGEPAWLRDARLAAADRYVATPWPKSDVGEEWRRFPIAEVPLDALEAREPTPARFETADLPRGVVAADLATAVREHGDLVRTWLGLDGGAVSHAAIRAFGHAAWTGGAFLYVPANVVLERPLALRTGAGTTRTIVVAERGSRVTLLEELESTDAGTRVAIPLLDVFAEDGANVEYVGIQNFGARVWDLGAQWYRSGRDTRIDSYNVLVGGGRTKLGVGSDIVGNGAVVHLYGLVAGGDDQKIDVNTFQDLAASHAESILLYLAALYGRSKAVTYGVIRVEPGTSGTSSYQECRNLLLSEEAGADPIPVLEILTNDVTRCGHGATAGAIDPAELFYIESRGLPRELAERLLVRGFFERVVSNLRDPGVRGRMLAALAPRIGTLAELEE